MTMYWMGSCCRAVPRGNLKHLSSFGSGAQKSTTISLHRHFASSTASAQDLPKSKRREFRETPVHPSIRRYIEMIGVGIPNRRKGSKRIRHHLFDHIEEGKRPGNTEPPPPFSAGPRRVVAIGSVAAPGDSFPTNKEKIPEVALAGRSNVGKSTLLNALLYGNRARKPQEGVKQENNQVRTFRRGTTPENVKMPKGIKAAVSAKPGETKRITFYQLGLPDSTVEHDTHHSQKKNPHQKLRLVDLPGYGFSFAPTGHDGFQELLLQYLLERGKALKRVLLLIDARHGLKKADLEFLLAMEEESYKSQNRKMPAIQIVLTKCDLVHRDDLARRVVHVRQELSDNLRREHSNLPVLLVSARPGVGFNNIQQSAHGGRAKGGILELQKELAALVPQGKRERKDS